MQLHQINVRRFQSLSPVHVQSPPPLSPPPPPLSLYPPPVSDDEESPFELLLSDDPQFDHDHDDESVDDEPSSDCLRLLISLRLLNGQIIAASLLPWLHA
jgi:hypothetical protein